MRKILKRLGAVKGKEGLTKCQRFRTVKDPSDLEIGWAGRGDHP